MSGPAAAPVRVAQVIPVDGIGGVEVAARSALPPGADMAFALVPIAGPSTPDAALVPARYRSPDDPRAIADAVRRVRALDPDVVVCSLWRSVPVLLALRLLRGRPRLVYFLHLESTVHLFDRVASSIGIATADEIWCDSAATQNRRLTGAKRRRSRVISFMTARAVAPPPPPPAAAFVLWARLNRQKGIDRALALVGALAARGAAPRFRVYGPDGGELAALTEQVRASGLDASVSFEGPIAPTERSAAAAGATFFLQPSRSEGMAMSVAEGMQLGLVPVVTAVGEMSRYVRDGENGIVIDPERLDEAANRLVALLADPPRLAAMRAAAIATWRDADLYRDDVARTARELSGRR